MTKKRSYRQFCSLARALDLVGERWTMLILRDLMAGPRRYKDLLSGLRGIGTNLLADRLKDLEKHGLVEKVNLPPSVLTQGYRLTPLGRGLEPALTSLARWGLPLLDQDRDEAMWLPQWNHLAMRARFDSEKAKGVHDIYGFEIAGYHYFVQIRDGEMSSFEGSAPHADVVLRGDEASFVSVFVDRTLDFEEACQSGRISLYGDRTALGRCLDIFGGFSDDDLAYSQAGFASSTQ